MSLENLRDKMALAFFKVEEFERLKGMLDSLWQHADENGRQRGAAKILSRLRELQSQVDVNFAATDKDFFEHSINTEDISVDVMFDYFHGDLSEDEEYIISNYLNPECGASKEISLRDMIIVGNLLLFYNVLEKPFTPDEHSEMFRKTRHVDNIMIFNYYEGDLDTDDIQEIEKLAETQPLFLQKLLGLGEVSLAWLLGIGEQVQDGVTSGGPEKVRLFGKVLMNRVAE